MDTSYSSAAPAPTVLLAKETLDYEHVETQTSMFIIIRSYYRKIGNNQDIYPQENKQIIVSSYDGMLPKRENKQTPATWIHMNESRKHFVEE